MSRYLRMGSWYLAVAVAGAATGCINSGCRFEYPAASKLLSANVGTRTNYLGPDCTITSTGPTSVLPLWGPSQPNTIRAGAQDCPPGSPMPSGAAASVGR